MIRISASITFCWNFPDHIERPACVKSSRKWSAFVWNKKISTIPSPSYTDFQNLILKFEIKGTEDFDLPGKFLLRVLISKSSLYYYSNNFLWQSRRWQLINPHIALVFFNPEIHSMASLPSGPAAVGMINSIFCINCRFNRIISVEKLQKIGGPLNTFVWIIDKVGLRGLRKKLCEPYNPSLHIWLSNIMTWPKKSAMCWCYI